MEILGEGEEGLILSLGRNTPTARRCHVEGAKCGLLSVSGEKPEMKCKPESVFWKTD